MKLLRCFCLVILSLLAASVSAQGAAGKWSATVEGRQGTRTMVFEFAVDGNKLTGTMTNNFMGSTPISDGEINGNELKFVVKFQGMNGTTRTIDYSGTVKGDEMTLTSKFENAPQGGPGGGARGPGGRTFTATRAKE